MAPPFFALQKLNLQFVKVQLTLCLSILIAAPFSFE